MTIASPSSAINSVSVILALVVALISLFGVIFTAYISRRSDERHQARETRLRPSEEYARTALDCLAKLRHVTPPPLKDETGPPHRNECLLADRNERAARLTICEDAIDDLRLVRGNVMLVFGPDNPTPECCRQVLASLRICLESAQTYYDACDTAGASTAWREARGKALQQEYIANRKIVYGSLDGFYKSVKGQLAKSWLG